MAFYHGTSAHEWWDVVPYPLVLDCLREMDALKAEENLRLMTIAALGAGNYSEETTGRITGDWVRAIRPLTPEEEKAARIQMLAQLRGRFDVQAVPIFMAEVETDD